MLCLFSQLSLPGFSGNGANDGLQGFPFSVSLRPVCITSRKEHVKRGLN